MTPLWKRNLIAMAMRGIRSDQPAPTQEAGTKTLDVQMVRLLYGDVAETERALCDLHEGIRIAYEVRGQKELVLRFVA